MKLFNAPLIGNEHIPPHKLIPKTLITQLRTRSYLHEYDAQGRGKPSPYPIRSVIPSRIGYGLGLPPHWSRGSSNRQGSQRPRLCPRPGHALDIQDSTAYDTTHKAVRLLIFGSY